MLNKCLESLTAIGCALGACATGLLDPGVAVGAIIGGAGLLARFRETSEKHGLDSESLIAKMRLAVIREWDKAEQTEAERDAIGAADAAMGKYLADCMPTREELAATALRGAKVYPVEAAALVVDRLAACNDECRALFAAPVEGTESGTARRFALTAVEAALRAAKDDPDYAPLLTLDLVIEVAGTVGRIEQGQGEDRARDEAFQAEMLKFIRTQQKGEGFSDEALRGAISRFIAFQPDASPKEVLDAIEVFETDYRALLDHVSRIEAVDNLVASYKAAAEAALHEGDIDAARAQYAKAIIAATEKAAEPVRNAAALVDADAVAALVALDWEAADTAWARAEAMLAPFDSDARASLSWDAAKRLEVFGDTFATPGALDVAIRRWRELHAHAAANGDVLLEASLANNLGNALSRQGNRTGGEAGLVLLAEAVSAYRAASLVYTETAMPTEWAMTQNNLGNALQTQGGRAGGEAGLALLAEAVSAHRAVLRVYTETATPADWAGTQNNLGNAFQTQGERTGGEPGLALLAEAISAYRAALRVRTETAMPGEWAATQNNLGAALRKKGDRSGGASGLALLAEAVLAYRAALRIRSEVSTPADWARTQNNLGAALSTQGNRTDGEGGLVLLADAVSAYRAALRVRTETTTPADWATTQNNLGNALSMMGQRIDGEVGLAMLAEAVSTYRAALRVRTDTTMPAQWAGTQNNLGNTLALQSERVGGEARSELLTEAVTAFRAALQVFTPEHFGHQHAAVTQNLSHIESLFAQRRS